LPIGIAAVVIEGKDMSPAFWARSRSASAIVVVAWARPSRLGPPTCRRDVF
jgi:hypothetical protein